MTRDPREALQGWIAATGYTNREIGALFGVTKPAVCQWTRGRVRVPERVQVRLRAEGWLMPMRKPKAPPLQHEPMCPTGQPCRSCSARRLRARQASRPAHNAWTPAQDARLTALAGHVSLAEVTAQLITEFGIPRSSAAVQCRGNRLGLSFITGGTNTLTLAYWCAVDQRTVGRWIRRGWIHPIARPYPRAPILFTDAAIETFIRAHYPVLHWQAMRCRRWRDLAEGLWRRDPIYTVAEAAALLGLRTELVRQYCGRGWLPAERFQGGQAVGWRGWWGVRRSALARFQVRRPASLGNHNGQRRPA